MERPGKLGQVAIWTEAVCPLDSREREELLPKVVEHSLPRWVCAQSPFTAWPNGSPLPKPQRHQELSGCARNNLYFVTRKSSAELLHQCKLCDLALSLPNPSLQPHLGPWG